MERGKPDGAQPQIRAVIFSIIEESIIGVGVDSPRVDDVSVECVGQAGGRSARSNGMSKAAIVEQV